MKERADRWSFTMELGNMWNMKPQHDVYALDNARHQHHAMDTMFSSSHLLTQLLVSQAILDSNDFQVLTFDTLDKLKKELSQIQDHLANISKNIQLESRIATISKSLENVNLKNSRNSVIYLQHQRQHNEHKIKYMSNQLESMRKREIEIKKIILQHTAGILNKGIHSLENQTLHQNNHHTALNQVINRIDQLYSSKISSSSSSSSSSSISTPASSLDTLQKLSLLEKLLLSGQSTEKDPVKANQNKMQLLAIKVQKDQLMSRMIDMELLTTKLLSHLSLFPQRQMAYKMELMQYQSESLELRIWDKRRQRNEDADNLSQALANHANGGSGHNMIAIKQRYQKQLEDQATSYEANISKQNALLQRNTQMKQHLEATCNDLVSEKSELERLVQEKTRQIDQQDNEMSRLNHELRNLRHPPAAAATPPRSKADDQYIEQEKKRLKQVFEERESRWTSHTTLMEDRFDQLLDNFDKLTNTAIEFDSHRMRYDKKIENLHQNINKLEMELYDEKVKRIGCTEGGGGAAAATTVSLRKEFRLLVADIKKTHQQRMDSEADEIRRLQLQLQELQSTNTKSHKYQHSMATQT
ncbi:uncharacterized protein ATC70_006759 [Mucor velutinosus]|uniref:Up-regulated during septation protein 1 domain-containing protein n=1 Tax=Mucor velutinosus TaxID=708070 RepID=A0AAN7DPC2_9FUNG|nr:hypothetical protein ATC70_006759 [Mucor velutinosus]